MKVKHCWRIHGHTILTFDSPLPLEHLHAKIDGATYETEIAYDIPNGIGIPVEINADGKEVEFF